MGLTLGFQELAIIFGLSFLIGLFHGLLLITRGRGKRWKRTLTVVGVVILLPIIPIGLMGLKAIGSTEWFEWLSAAVLGELAWALMAAILFGLPYCAGAMLWPPRRQRQ